MQTATENERRCSTFPRGLVDRGLRIDAGLLRVINGVKGLRKAVDNVDYWKNADQKHRWLATALLDIERRLDKTYGCKDDARARTHRETHFIDYLLVSQETPVRRALVIVDQRP